MSSLIWEFKQVVASNCVCWEFTISTKSCSCELEPLELCYQKTNKSFKPTASVHIWFGLFAFFCVWNRSTSLYVLLRFFDAYLGDQLLVSHLLQNNNNNCEVWCFLYVYSTWVCWICIKIHLHSKKNTKQTILSSGFENKQSKIHSKSSDQRIKLFDSTMFERERDSQRLVFCANEQKTK